MSRRCDERQGLGSIYKGNWRQRIMKI